MAYKFNYITLVLSLCMLLTACKEDVVYVIQNPETPEVGEKTPIELTVGGVNTQGLVTRAVVTDGATNTDFGRNTKVFILMRSDVEYDDENNKIVEHDGLEFKGNRAKTLYTVSRGDVVYNTDHTKLVFDEVNQKYWDDAHARSSQLTLWAVAQKVAETKDGSWKNITFQKIDGNVVDKPGISDASDAGYNTNTRNEWQGTTEVYPAIFSWSVGNHTSGHQNQDANTIIYQDLLFSNNFADYVGYNKVPETSRTDNRLKFDFTTRKFPASPEMKFYHAMSKITIKIKAGEGFKVDGTDFELDNSTCIDTLRGFNTRGLFNIKDGEFQMIHNHEDITKIPSTKNGHTSNDPYYTLEFLAIPNIHEFMLTQRPEHPEAKDEFSRFVKDKKDLTNDADVMMQFTIDHNTYKITSDALFDALMQHNADGTQKGDAVTGATKKTGTGDDASMGTYIPLEAGKNYVFTFVVSKTKISGITAKVVDWEEVTAEEINPTNARVTLALDGRGDAKGIDVAFYRALNESSTIDDTYTSYDWAKTYERSNSAEYQSSQWKTEWYWPNNKSFYHFRAISPANTTATTPDDADNYFGLSSSSATLDGDGNPDYNEIAWGAPFVSGNTTFSYSTTKGFDGTGAEAAEEASRTHQIHKAIGPTDSQIKLLMFHMMSGVHFRIITETADGATNKVELCHNNGGDPVTYIHPTVQLVGYYPSGKVYMGDGHVVADGDPTTTSVAGITCRTETTGTYDSQDYYYSAVPQALTGANATDPGVQLYITTPDNNQYIVNLKDVLATSVSNNNITNSYTKDANKWKIDRWYPGFQYNYTLKLTKKGIDNITATIVNWETVEATYDYVQIQ